MSAFARASGDAFYCGIWRSRLLQGLLWRDQYRIPTEKPKEFQELLSDMKTNIRNAPSWSWASRCDVEYLSKLDWENWAYEDEALLCYRAARDTSTALTSMGDQGSPSSVREELHLLAHRREIPWDVGVKLEQSGACFGNQPVLGTWDFRVADNMGAVDFAGLQMVMLYTAEVDPEERTYNIYGLFVYPTGEDCYYRVGTFHIQCYKHSGWIEGTPNALTWFKSRPPVYTILI
jgi:hypothetical protein